MVLFSGTTDVDEKNTAAGPGEINAAVGVESDLFLLKVPEMGVLTLQMEQEVNKNELS